MKILLIIGIGNPSQELIFCCLIALLMNLLEYFYFTLKTFENIKSVFFAERIRKLKFFFPTENVHLYTNHFYKFKNLKTLDIHNTEISSPCTTLPKEIGNLKTLKKLTTLNVLFDEFPDWIANLTNLEYLMVRGCELKEIPSFISNLKKLKVLKVENCELNSLPKELAQMSSIRELSIVATPINYIPLENLPKNLKILNLGFTHIDKKELERVQNALPNVKVFPILKNSN